jgi:hypothetical protein
MFGQELGLGFAEDARIEKDALAHRSAANGGRVMLRTIANLNKLSATMRP